jgi:hypothetical protein
MRDVEIAISTSEGRKMTMRRRFLLLLMGIAALVVTASPVAANSTPTTGTRINLFAAPATFEADTPFYIEHGTGCDPSVGDKVSACMNADAHFDLYLDGALQASTVDIENSPTGWVKLNLTNYPAGLAAGRHTFVGVWVQGGNVALTMTASINFR